MGKTNIEWTEMSWSPVTGCTKVSEGCRNCYAERMAKRLAGRYGYPEQPHHFDVTVHEDKLDQPLRWKKPRMIFVCSMGDLFHEDVPDELIIAIFGVMAAADQHVYQVLTKRPKRMMDLFGNNAKSTAMKVDLYKHVALADRINEVFAVERTKPIKGWPGYFVTTRGRILSERNNGGNRDSGIMHELKPQPGKQGHSRVELQVNGSSIRPLVHRLVLSAFDRPARGGEQSCHIDGDATNNSLWNLRWGSQSDNWDDSKRHGTRRRYSKINKKQVAEIRGRLKAGESAYAIAPDYNISDTQILNIVRGDQWEPEYIYEWPLRSVWLGATAENQETANERIPWLLYTPATLHFVSVEPMLSSINMDDFQPFRRKFKGFRAARGIMKGKIDWVIVGGETGHGAREMKASWAFGLYQQCREAEVPFFFKKPGDAFTGHVQNLPTTIRQWPNSPITKNQSLPGGLS